MISRLFALLVRVLLEAAVLLLIVGLLLGVFAFRTSRRLVSAKDGRLDRFSGTVAPLLAMVAALQKAAREPDNPPAEGYDPG